MATKKRNQAAERRAHAPEGEGAPARTTRPPTLVEAPFRECAERDPELAALRAEYARKRPTTRRKAAIWAYDSSLANSMFGRMMAQVEKDPWWMPDYAEGVESLTIDPVYAPALLTVGSIEYQLGRRDEAMEMFLTLTTLPADEEDLAMIIDKAGDFLIDCDDFTRALQLYVAAEETYPTEATHPVGACYCLGKLGRKDDAIVKARRAVELEPQNHLHWNDLGWSLYEAGQLDEAETCLRRAIELSAGPYERAKNNLATVLAAKAALSRQRRGRRSARNSRKGPEHRQS